MLQLKANYDFNKSKILLDLKDIVNGMSESKFNMFYKVKLSVLDSTVKINQNNLTVECIVF